MRRLERRRQREAKKEEKEKCKQDNERADPVPDRGEREEKEKDTEKDTEVAGAEGKGSEAESTSGPAKSRYIRPEVRERVLERAGYQCEYQGPDGTRCTSRTGLEVRDASWRATSHSRPFAVYQSHDER